MWDFSACFVKSLACVRKSDATTVGTTTPKRTLRRSFCAHVRSFHTSVLSAIFDDRIKHNEGGPAKEGQNSHRSQEMSRHLNNLHLNVQLQSQQYPSISVLIRLGLQSHFEGRQHCRVHQEQNLADSKAFPPPHGPLPCTLWKVLWGTTAFKRVQFFIVRPQWPCSPPWQLLPLYAQVLLASSTHFWCTSRKQPLILAQTQSGSLRAQRSLSVVVFTSV